jgi:hypothetical protein
MLSNVTRAPSTSMASPSAYRGSADGMAMAVTIDLMANSSSTTTKRRPPRRKTSAPGSTRSAERQTFMPLRFIASTSVVPSSDGDAAIT